MVKKKRSERNKENTTYTEQATRKRMLADVRERFGITGETQLKQLFDKWDKLVISCKNDSERAHMKKMACAEIFKAIGYRGGLTVGGDVVIPDDNDPKFLG